MSRISEFFGESEDETPETSETVESRLEQLGEAADQAIEDDETASDLLVFPEGLEDAPARTPEEQQEAIRDLAAALYLLQGVQQEEIPSDPDEIVIEPEDQ